MSELETRFGKVARGRAVSVTDEPHDSILAYDYHVRYSSETNTFHVLLRRGGYFDGAYRCIERWIEAEAERLDGIDSVAADHVDFRRQMQYWGVEEIYEHFRSDVDSAIGEMVSWLTTTQGEHTSGGLSAEARAHALSGLLAYLRRIDAEVRHGVLSPRAIELWKSIGLDVFPPAEEQAAPSDEQSG
ncbi:MAG TPA: hypothetical protein VFW98_17540 [Gemmatimonadaceae bacterium]|nr:hypothetical protein [Gemmatimonadaceae bacterium]